MMPKSKNRRKNGKTALQMSKRKKVQQKDVQQKDVQNRGLRFITVSVVPFDADLIGLLCTVWYRKTGELCDPYQLSGSYGDFVAESLMYLSLVDRLDLSFRKGTTVLFSLDIDLAYPPEFRDKISEAFRKTPFITYYV